MDSLEARERNRYERVWMFDQYADHSPGVRALDWMLEAMNPEPGSSFIDFGVGSGQAAGKLIAKGFRVTGVDIAFNCLRTDVPFLRACLWDLPDLQADYGYCTDVMEHIPPEKVDAVLDGINRACAKAVCFTIATRPDGSGPKFIGEPLHLTVQPIAWWQKQLERRWAVTTRERGRDGWFVCYRT